jgi:outer membrane lipoprotein SlyB
MLARFRELCLDANDPAVVGAFWAAVLGREVEDAGEGDGTSRDVFLAAGADGGPSIYVNGVPEPKTGKVRIHLDVTLEPGQEISHLLSLGATVVTEPGAVRWWVLADPEGHEFCAFLPDPEPTA